MYAKVKNGKVIQYPYNLSQLRAENPNTSFPKNPPDEVLADFGIVIVGEGTRPEYNPETQKVEEVREPVFSGNRWVRQYVVKDLTFEEKSLILQVERKRMRVFKRALNLALSQLPVTFSPTLSAAFPDAPNLLAAVDMYEETLDPYNPFRLARRDITEYVRVHPDVEGFKQLLGIGDNKLDQLFRAAMALEAA